MEISARKRIITVLISITLILGLFGLSGCGVSDTPQPEPAPEQSGQEEQSSQPEESHQESEPQEKEISEPESALTVRIINCGQGDASMIECDGHYMIIDGGDRTNSQKMYSLLKQEGIGHLDLLVATHPHADHIGGLPGVLEYADADTVLCNVDTYESGEFADFKLRVEKTGKAITVPEVGSTYSLGSASVKVLGLNAGENDNNNSIILKITFKETSFLFTGDAGPVGETAVMNSGSDLGADVLKVAHHGADSATSELFLDAVSPSYAVISVGKGNDYGHPCEATLNKLHDDNIKIYRTDLQGDILIRSDGKTVSFGTEKQVAEEELLISGMPVQEFQTESMPDRSVATAEESSSGQETANPQGGQKAEESHAAEESEPTRSASAADCDYVVNVNSRKFHYPNCKSVKVMNEENKLFYIGSRDELIAKGYKPCGNCNP